MFDRPRDRAALLGFVGALVVVGLHVVPAAAGLGANRYVLVVRLFGAAAYLGMVVPGLLNVERAGGVEAWEADLTEE
jgi:hypothetical protein